MTTLRIISINLLSGKASSRGLERMLRRLDPDAVACQELYPHHAAIIRQQLPYGRLDARRDYHGLGIALRHPAAVERLPLTHRDGWRALLTPAEWPGLSRDVELLNVHILNPLAPDFVRAIRERGAMASEIIDHIRSRRMPRIVVGDMNSSPIWPVYRRLVATIQDGAVAAGTAKRTWAPLWWLPRMLRIDHVFVEGVVPVRTWTERLRGSDHSALVADVEVP